MSPTQTRSAVHGTGTGTGTGTAAGDVGIDSHGTVTRTYPHGASGTWGSIGIKVNHPTERRLLAFLPEPFMQRCGDNTWSYVYKILEMTTECGRNGMVWGGGENGMAYPRESRDVPVTGTYVLKMEDNSAVKISRGPSNKRGKHFGAPTLDESESTVSRSSRSTVNQANFKHELAIREGGQCLVSEAWHRSCIGAHIVPFSRQDIYEDIYDTLYHQKLFDTSSGLLLRDDLHRAFDRYEWAIYCGDDGALYVHIFVASDRTYLQYHGKKIDPVTRFKIQDPSTGIGYPDPTLLQWHYKQCVQARIRGYAYDMSINAQGGVVAT